MKIIIVAGASSTAAKTTLAESLLRKLGPRGWGGVKITVTHDIVDGCPRGGDGCGICESVPTGYQIVTDLQTITQPRTDTGRLSDAGAKRVLWAITTPTHIARAWAGLQQLLGSVPGVVVESNSLALCLTPDITFFTINPRVPRSRWKASAPVLIERSDFVIISLHDARRSPAQALIDEVTTKRNGQGVIITRAVEDVPDWQDVEVRLRPFTRG